VVVLAQDESREFGHGYIGVEHLLIGLLREKEGLAHRALRGAGLTVDALLIKSGRSWASATHRLPGSSAHAGTRRSPLEQSPSRRALDTTS